MDYLLFTYPNCLKCEDLKAHLRGAAIAAEIQDAAAPEGRTRIRAFLPHIKRDDKGAIILPTLVCHESGKVEAVIHSAEEFAEWFRSRG